MKRIICLFSLVFMLGCQKTVKTTETYSFIQPINQSEFLRFTKGTQISPNIIVIEGGYLNAVEVIDQPEHQILVK